MIAELDVYAVKQSTLKLSRFVRNMKTYRPKDLRPGPLSIHLQIIIIEYHPWITASLKAFPYPGLRLIKNVIQNYVQIGRSVIFCIKRQKNITHCIGVE